MKATKLLAYVLLTCATPNFAPSVAPDSAPSFAPSFAHAQDVVGVGTILDDDAAAAFATWTAVPGAQNYRLFWDTDSGAPYRYHCDVGNVTSIATKASLPASCEPLVDGTWIFNITPIDDQGFQGAYTTEDAGNVITGLKTACNQTLSPGAAIGTAISAAPAGNIICLQSGNYPPFNLASVVKNPRVRVRSITQNGAVVTGGVNWTGTTSGITLDGVTFQGLNIIDDPGLNNITLRAYTGTHGIDVDGPTAAEPNILIEDVIWNNIDILNGTITVSNAIIYFGSRVTVRNVTMNGGCADGFQGGGPIVLEDSRIMNRLDTLGGTNCSTAHTDGFQVCCGAGSASGGIIRRNYWETNIQVLTAFDEVAGVLVENNLFYAGSTVINPARPSQVEWYGDNGSIFRYNTSSWWSSTIPAGLELNRRTSHPLGGNTQVYDNNFPTIDVVNGATTAINRNNCVRAGSSPNVVGIPTFVGGVHPQTFAGALMTPGSPCAGLGQGGINPGIQFRNLPAVASFVVNP